jgi:hypothetical protein
MKILDHGKWIAYEPDVPHKDAPLNTMYCRRESDGMDWYDYIRSGKRFSKDTIKFMAMEHGPNTGFIIGPVTKDVTKLFPAGHIVGEILDCGSLNSQKEFGQRIYDPNKRQILEKRK